MRKLYTDDRVDTDPHGFTPVPEPSVPRQRSRRPAHDPWDPAHAPDPGAPRSAGALFDDEVDDAPEPPARPRRARSGRRRDGPARTASSTGRNPRRPRTERSGASPRRRTSRSAPDRPPRSGSAPVPPTDAGGLRATTLLVPVAVGTLVAVAIGVWARTQVPTGIAVNIAGFSSAGAVKTWLGSLALVLALAQGWTGMVLAGRIGSGPTPLVAAVHRWSGRLAVLVTVPVAIQCLVALGWSGATTRTLVHSLLGCVFYGAFATKMLLLRRPGVPAWVVAVSGGVLLAVLTGIWLTSALWFFGTHGPSF